MGEPGATIHVMKKIMVLIYIIQGEQRCIVSLGENCSIDWIGYVLRFPGVVVGHGEGGGLILRTKNDVR